MKGTMAVNKEKRTIKMEDLLNTSAEKEITVEVTNVEKAETIKQTKKKKKQEQIEVPRGKPKSGRIWKNTKTRFSSIVKTRGIRNSFEKKQLLREELKRVKEASRVIAAAKQEEKEQKKERRRENLKRQEENRKKSEIVQVITNSNKIKKMKKKHLRTIEKRDTTNM